MKQKISIMESFKEDINLVINSPAALKHLSASTEDGGRVFTVQTNFQFLKHFGTKILCGQLVEWCVDAQCTLTQESCGYAVCLYLHYKTCFDFLKS